ncbi:competence/damage-inducible protein A [Roseateles puraquae]|uniref:Competence/damage-inducible protein A n=1 Tax=Roseateles puraquae TaxID=431059 RepID=A0A254N8A2_9BURK|nr:molybdopterin-binding protein [Roseateles puraquae]MDG0853285.1 competence/damage-inducible protein A [Roseateles puraquae]OWR03784.1 competence/damage-inducible protein A [Roseateles puraquae]
MQVGLIIVGDEILSGKRRDSHLAKFIELLAERGMQLSWAQYLGDDRELLTARLREAFASGQLVVSCGGIGATPDDHTRQAAAAALDRPLALHPEARELIWLRIQQMAAEQGKTVTADEPDSVRRFEMGVFPEGAGIIPNPYNKIPGFFVGNVHFVPGFPVMAHPMMAWVLDRYPQLHRQVGVLERSLIVQGAMEASLTPLMESVESGFPGIKVFSLPSVDHPQWGRCIELGVKGDAEQMEAAYGALKQGVIQFGATISTEMVR